MKRFAKYFRGAFREIGKVTWPKRREAMKLTFAVIVFSLAFALFTGVVDGGLTILFEKFVLKG